MPNNQLSKFPEYQCHKKVLAFKITEVTPRIGDVLLSSSEFPNDPVSVDIPWYLKFKPEVDSYFISYEDGYNSVSPAIPFESGYSLIPIVSSVEETLIPVPSIDPAISSTSNEIVQNSVAPQTT